MKSIKSINAPGKLVAVNDAQIHCYRVPQAPPEGQGTMVFLAGSGTECPTYDFKPLWQLLIGRFDLVVVERPGYGWSSQTALPRDIDTVLEETREALRLAEIKGPFIPAPHSLSGLEALYWAQKYPGEIQAVVGLDMAVPPVYDSMEPPKFISLQAGLAHLLRGPVAGAMVKSHPAVKDNLLSGEEQAAMRGIISRQLLSKNMMDEIGFVKENARKVARGGCPAVPVLCCLSSDKDMLKRFPLWGRVHRDYFAANQQVEFVELPCGHYVHREAPKLIAEAVSLFFSREGPAGLREAAQ